MKPQIFGDGILGWLGPWPLTRTMASSAAVSVILVALAITVTWKVRTAPGGRTAAAARLALGFLDDLVAGAAERPSPDLEVFAGTLFLFIATSALIGQLPGVAAPTANLSATSALAVIVFLAVPIAGVKARGPRAYFREYLSPNPILLPLHVVSEFSRTLALALRLFGNMMSGHLIVGLLVALTGLVVPVPLMALDLLIGLLQAYIFTVLACVYIGAGVRIGDQHD